MPSGGIAELAGLGIGLGQTIYGAIAKHKAQQAANGNIMPKYNIPQEEYDNLNLAESQANQGMSAAASQQLLTNAQNAQSGAIGGLLKGGGDVNTIGSIVDKTQNSLNQNAIYDDSARMQHLSNLQSERNRLSAQKDKQWQINEYQPWANKAQALNGQLAGAQNMEMAGINTAGKALTGYLGMLGKNKPIDLGETNQQQNAPQNGNFTNNFGMSPDAGNPYTWNGIMPQLNNGDGGQTGIGATNKWPNFYDNTQG